MTVLRLDRIALNVRDLDTATHFYCDALGFEAGRVREADPAIAALLGFSRLRTALLCRGDQTIELCAGDPTGAPYPSLPHANDPWFQHCALVTDDLEASLARLEGHDFTPISRGGAQTLPGGIAAFKFRDPDGHPLELIAFPEPDPATSRGIDHSAICVASAARSIAFYTGELGMSVASRQVNQGPAQDALDGLDGVVVDVVALTPAQAAPHVELLCYRAPKAPPPRALAACDIAATRLVFAAILDMPATNLADGTRLRLLRDPDGHAILLEQRAGTA